MNRALVTGANGFIGRRLVGALLERGVEVVALDLPGADVPEHWDVKVEVVRGDVRHLLEMGPAIRGVDTIFHLAAIVSDWGAIGQHVSVTVEGTVQALELAARTGARFVVTTSIAAYASRLGSGELREDQACGKPASAYEFVKQEQERVTRAAARELGIDTVVVRPGNVYGIDSGPWVKSVVELMSRGMPVIVGDGDFDAGLCHVDNLVSLLCLCGQNSNAVDQIFNAADGFGLTWREYLGELAEIYQLGEAKKMPAWLARAAAPVCEVLWRAARSKTRPPLTRLALRLTGGPNQISVVKARKLLGYEPAVTPNQGMAELRAAARL